MSQNDRYLSKTELAEFLSISTRQIDRLDSDTSPSRTFPEPVRILNRKRWLYSAVASWAANQD